MRVILLIIGIVGSIQAQEVAKVAGAETFSTSGRFFVTTRQPPSTGGTKPAPEIYEIITGQDGTASVALGALGNVKMEPNTHIRVSSPTSPQSLEMLKGKLFLHIDAAELKKKQNTEFKLRTPTALLAVKGTSFFVAVEGGKETLGVHEGAAMVQTPSSRAGVLLQTGQASVNAPGQPLQPQAMSGEEMALNKEYATLNPTKDELALLVSSGTSGVVARYHQGALTTGSGTDNGAPPGPSAAIASTGTPACALALKETGVVQMQTLQSSGVLSQSLSLTVGTASVTKPFAMRFYFRAPSGIKVTVNGRVMTPPERKAGTPQPPATSWIDCLLGLSAGSSKFELTLAIEAPQARPRKIKEGELLLELSDFVLLSAPAASKP